MQVDGVLAGHHVLDGGTLLLAGLLNVGHLCDGVNLMQREEVGWGD